MITFVIITIGSIAIFIIAKSIIKPYLAEYQKSLLVKKQEQEDNYMKMKARSKQEGTEQLKKQIEKITDRVVYKLHVDSDTARTDAFMDTQALCNNLKNQTNDTLIDFLKIEIKRIHKTAKARKEPNIVQLIESYGFKL